MAKRFDLTTYKLQIAIINNSPRQAALAKNIIDIGRRLLRRRNVPAIGEKIDTILEVISIDFWSHISLAQVEHFRKELRDLIQLLGEENNIKPIYTDLRDSMEYEEIKGYDIISSFKNLQSYRDRVEAFIRKNKHHLVIDKLYKNLPISAFELQQLEQYLLAEALDSKEKFVEEFGDQPLGTFIRTVIGLDQNAVHQNFVQFIQEANLSANQIKFVDTIIKYFAQNGYLDQFQLTNPPFTDLHDGGVMGIFEDHHIHNLVELIKDVNSNAQIGA